MKTIQEVELRPCTSLHRHNNNVALIHSKGLVYINRKYSCVDQSEIYGFVDSCSDRIVGSICL